jgi:hypothetical protein
MPLQLRVPLKRKSIDRMRPETGAARRVTVNEWCSQPLERFSSVSQSSPLLRFHQ